MEPLKSPVPQDIGVLVYLTSCMIPPLHRPELPVDARVGHNLLEMVLSVSFLARRLMLRCHLLLRHLLTGLLRRTDHGRLAGAGDGTGPGMYLAGTRIWTGEWTHLIHIVAIHQRGGMRVERWW